MYRFGGKEVGVEFVFDSFYFFCEVRFNVNCWGEEAELEVEMG